MQKGIEKRRLSLWAGAVAALALSGSGMTEWKRQAAHDSTLESDKVIARSETVCRRFIPASGDIRIAVEREVMANADGTDRLYWLVDCLDADGGERAHMIWDSTDGRLNTVSRQTPVSSRKLAHPIDRRQAVLLAAHSLRKLPITTTGERWRLKEVELARTAWHVSCRTHSSRAHVVIDAATGDLLSVFGGRPQAIRRS